MKKPANTSWRGGVALMIGLLSAGCAHYPREPLVQQPMSVRPDPKAQIAPSPSPGAIYRPGAGSQALFEDRRPRLVGDILTILVAENVNASKNSASNISRTGSTGSDLSGLPQIFGGLISGAQTASGKNILTAKGGANAANTFNGVITVTIVDVLGNGNLQVSGEKQMLINQGTEFIRFSGVVNPRMVGPNNTVLSTQVADARIEYSAKGYIDEAQSMGWLQRFFLNVLPM